MPSPVGHALAGAAVGWIVAGAAPASAGPARRTLWRRGLACAALGMAPDLDLLVGAHSGPTHSIGAAALVAVATLLLTRNTRLSVAAMLAYAAHPVLDMLGTDSSPPIGVMALWPFSREHFATDTHVFYAVSRRYWTADFVARTVRAITWELLVLVPVAAAAYWIRRRQPPQVVNQYL